MRNTPKNGGGAAESGRLGELARPVARVAPVCLLAFVLLDRPMASGLVPEIAPLAAFGMLLLGALFFWVCNGVLSGTLRWRVGVETALFAAFMLWSLLSCWRGHDGLASARIWWLFATYGLTGFLVLQLAGSGARRRFLVSCLAATVVALAGYAVLHYTVYRPAYGEWIRKDPAYFKALFDVREAGFRDFYLRVTGPRAVGNFITSNQLAGFLLLGLFPLCAVAAALWVPAAPHGKARSSARPHRERPAGGKHLAAAFGCTAGAALVLVALFLSGSKGGMFACAFGLMVFALVAARKWLRRNLHKVLVGAALLVGLFLAGQRLGVVPGWQRFGASLGVRLDYWRVSTQMIEKHPIAGVGPGCWKEYYTMLKRPEYEETRLAHNAYLQIWSETGTVGFMLFALFLGVFAVRVLRKASAERTPDQPEAGPERIPYRAGMALGGGAFVLHGFFTGAFAPPRIGAPKLLEAAPWLVYILLFCLWAGAFTVMHVALGDSRQPSGARAERFLVWGLIAGLAAFLLHSGAEFTLRVPALGGTAFAMGALLLVYAAPPRLRETSFAGRLGAVALILSFVPALGWSLLVTPRAFEYSFQNHRVLMLKGDLSGGGAGQRDSNLSPEEAVEKRREILDAYRSAVRAVPWDNGCWQERASEAYRLAREMLALGARTGKAPESRAVRALMEEAETSARRAVELNALRAKNWQTLGRLLADAGKVQEAVSCLSRAAALHPTLPGSWFQFAEAARRIEGPSPRVCEAYQRADSLNVRLTDDQGRFVKGQYHERNLLSEEQSTRLQKVLRDCARK